MRKYSFESHLGECANLTLGSDVMKQIVLRQYGLQRSDMKAVAKTRASNIIPMVLREKEYNIGSVNKVFSSNWLTNRHVVFGTKCNKLIVLDLKTGHMTNIPLLTSSKSSTPADCPCGIHGMSVNPSRTLFATGADNTNDVAVYRLPTFDPICVGEGAHSDWIFDMAWIDDNHLVTGSRDSKLALWLIPNSTCSRCFDEDECYMRYTHLTPATVQTVPKSERVRSMTFNAKKKELAVLSLNARLNIWNVETFEQVKCRALDYLRENVCLCINNDCSLYAVGSQSHVTLIDPISVNITQVITAKHGCGIRSLSFQDNILTIGTGIGLVLFYDVRSNKYLECHCKSQCCLTTGSGWLLHDDNYRDFFMDQVYPNALYTHCYDSSGTRLFMAGGPLPAGLYGNYAALWS